MKGRGSLASLFPTAPVQWLFKAGITLLMLFDGNMQVKHLGLFRDDASFRLVWLQHKQVLNRFQPGAKGG